LYIHNVITAKQERYNIACIIADAGDDDIIPSKTVNKRNAGITARMSALPAAWNSLNLDIFFMITALEEILKLKIRYYFREVFPPQIRKRALTP